VRMVRVLFVLVMVEMFVVMFLDWMVMGISAIPERWSRRRIRCAMMRTRSNR